MPDDVVILLIPFPVPSTINPLDDRGLNMLSVTSVKSDKIPILNVKK